MRILLLISLLFLLSGCAVEQQPSQEVQPSPALESSDYIEKNSGFAEAIASIGLCNSKPGKTVHFKSSYVLDESTGSSNFVFCATSTNDCSSQLHEYLSDGDAMKVENGIQTPFSDS